VAVAVTALLIVGVGAMAATSTPTSASTPTWVATANNAFAADLYGRLASTDGNLFFSPNSIETALMMTYTGAGGDTAAQMVKVLHLPVVAGEFDPAQFHRALGAFLNDLNAEKGPDGKPRGYQLSVANALWGQRGHKFFPEFLGFLKTNYGAGLTDLDFVKDPEAARLAINTWVEKATQEKIKDLIGKGVLDANTKLVLTNAIYFKGDWATSFKKDFTQNLPFHLAADKAVTVPMMKRMDDYEYAEDEGLQILKMPYVGDEVSMVILLPKKVDGLADLQKRLTPENLDKWGRAGKTQKVVVTLPKFKLTAEFELSKTLAAMGMPDAFALGKADFSGMDGTRTLFISAVIHKSFLDINEEGTEAAAATAAVPTASAPRHEPPPPVFKADHPFLFLIRHEKSGAILFMGRVATLEGPAAASK
jgi:serpin B